MKMDLENEYITYFKNFFNNVRLEYNKSICTKKDDELPSRELAFRDAINSLPCPVFILRIRNNTDKQEIVKSNIIHLIKYDLSKFGDSTVKYFGETDFEEIKKNEGILECFNLDEEKFKGIELLKTIGYGDVDSWWRIQIVDYDILSHQEQYIRDFIGFIKTIFMDKILEKFEKRIDYNSKYGLKNDPILSLSEIIKKDNILNAFVTIERNGIYRKLSISDLQRSICDIQLIPQVPEDVRNIFNAAKKLYVFSYFEYYFSTISQHYAFLALESALRNKYIEIFGEPRKFIPLGVVIKKLVEKKVITKGEAIIYDTRSYLRNLLSHLTRQLIFSFEPSTLRRIAYEINRLYDNSK